MQEGEHRHSLIGDIERHNHQPRDVPVTVAHEGGDHRQAAIFDRGEEYCFAEAQRIDRAKRGRPLEKQQEKRELLAHMPIGQKPQSSAMSARTASPYVMVVASITRFLAVGSVLSRRREARFGVPSSGFANVPGLAPTSVSNSCARWPSRSWSCTKLALGSLSSNHCRAVWICAAPAAAAAIAPSRSMISPREEKRRDSVL